MAHIIAIAVHRGGTGKTTTAMNLGAGLARAGKRTLLLDLDPQGHATVGLGIELGPQDPTLRDFFSDPPKPLPEIIRESPIAGLFIAPSNIRLARVAQGLYARPRREEMLKRGLEPVRNEFEYIIADCPPSLGVLTENAIAAASGIIIPCQMEGRAADALQDITEVIALIRGDKFSGWRLLLTRVDARTPSVNELGMAALEPWKGRMFQTTIPVGSAAVKAAMAGADLYSFDPSSKVAAAYEALTREILDHGW